MYKKIIDESKVMIGRLVRFIFTSRITWYCLAVLAIELALRKLVPKDNPEQ